MRTSALTDSDLDGVGFLQKTEPFIMELTTYIAQESEKLKEGLQEEEQSQTCLAAASHHGGEPSDKAQCV